MNIPFPEKDIRRTEIRNRDSTRKAKLERGERMTVPKMLRTLTSNFRS